MSITKDRLRKMLNDNYKERDDGITEVPTAWHDAMMVLLHELLWDKEVDYVYGINKNGRPPNM